MDNVERVIEKLDNGVRITLTSDDPEVVARLQQGPPEGRRPRPETINETREPIDNGVVITITSDDPAEVERIQRMAERGFGGPGGRGPGGPGGPGGPRGPGGPPPAQ